MDIMEAITSRRSIRSYQDRPVEQDKLNLILEAGRLAPSARNLQDWRFVVVQDKDKRQELSTAARGQAFVAQAPVVIAACGTETEYVMTCGQHCYPIDVTIDRMSLMATDLGLGSCWIGAFYEDQVKQILGIPENIRVVTMLALAIRPRPLLLDHARG